MNDNITNEILVKGHYLMATELADNLRPVIAGLENHRKYGRLARELNPLARLEGSRYF